MSRTQTFCEIATLDFSYLVTVKSTVEILQNFVAFSEYTYELYHGIFDKIADYEKNENL